MEQSITDPCHHIKIYQKLDYFLQTQKIPNIIFHGPSGTGKKTIVHNFINEIYKSDKSKLKLNVMSVNCCHGKGIKFIREELKFFSKINIQYSYGVCFKSIILYNADCLTIDAQSALRRCIELFSHNTRFFIVVENIHKLLNPIISRFCEIYVPEWFDITSTNGAFVHLHHREILLAEDSNDTEKRNLQTEKIDAKIKEIVEKIETVEETKPVTISPLLIDTSCYFYDNGISAMDVLAYIKTPTNPPFYSSAVTKTSTHPPFPKKNISSIELFFYKSKANYRCEKLLIFHLLWKIFNMRPYP
jgi:hypothetical protein